MARKKVSTEPMLSSWAAVDEAMRQIQKLEDAVLAQEMEMNRAIAKVKASCEKAAGPILAEIREFERQIKEFVTAYREELEGKTRKLNFGSTGFRLSTKLVVPGKPEDMVATLRRLGMEDCISVKEAVNKDALKQKPTEDILKTGAYLRQTDEFWYEINREEIQDAGQ